MRLGTTNNKKHHLLCFTCVLSYLSCGLRLFKFLLLFYLASFVWTQLKANDDPFASLPDIDFDSVDSAWDTESSEFNSGKDADNPASQSSSKSSKSLWRSNAKLSTNISANGKIFRDNSIKQQSNKDNLLHLRSLGLLLDIDLQASLTLLRSNRQAQKENTIKRKRLSLVTNFYAQANNSQANNPQDTDSTVPPELAHFRFGFRQLYGSFFASLNPNSGSNGAESTEGVELEASIGKRPYAQGVSIYFNPINYLDDSGSFFEVKNNWQFLVGLSWPNWALKLRYMPVFRFHEDSDLQANILNTNNEANYDSWEYAFSFLESRNRRQIISLESSLLLGESNWHLIGYMIEKQRYNWGEGFYLALGASGLLPFIIGKQSFQIYGEGLLGNGINKLGTLKESGFRPIPNTNGTNGTPPKYLWENADLDVLQFRGLLGLHWTPIANFDIYLEYRYDGSAFSAEQLKRLTRGLEIYHTNYKDPRRGLFWQSTIQRNAFANPFALTQHIVTLAFIWRNIADYIDLQANYFFALPDTSSAIDIQASLYLLNRSLKLYAHNRWYLPGFEQVGAFGLVPYLASIELGLELQP